MADEDFGYDFDDEIEAYDLLALANDIDSASQLAADRSRQPPANPPQQGLQRKANPVAPANNHGRAFAPQPPRLHRNPVSFGDTDLPTLDASVLGSSFGSFPVVENLAGIHNGRHSDYTGSSKDSWAGARVTTGLQEPAQAAAVEQNAPDDLGTLVGYENRHSTNVGAGKMDVEHMLKQIDQLTKDRQKLLDELAASRMDAGRRAGEIAIIRSNQTKKEQTYNQQLIALQGALDEELKKHENLMNAAVAESKRVATENQFLKQDLREERLRLNKIQQTRKSKTRPDDAVPTTPSKQRFLPLRDGFDNDEILPSPSKSAGRRSKRGTPSGKRKRSTVEDSPLIPVLELSQSFESNLLEPVETHGGMSVDRPVVLSSEDRNAYFMRKIFSHSSDSRGTRDFEVFSRMAFPSEPQKFFSSYVLEATAIASGSYAVQYANVIISLWTRALKESFFEPISLFMSIITFVLNLDINEIAPLLIHNLVPILQQTVYINAVPRFEASPVSQLSYGQVKQTPQKSLKYKVNGTEALKLLYLTASGCCHDMECRRRFWCEMHYDFVLIMLSPYQPIKDIILMFNILFYSTLPTTFGPILVEEAKQTSNHDYIIDRTANLLHEQPSVDEGREPYSNWEITTLRKEAMLFLLEMAFASTSPNPNDNFIGRAIAAHPTALARFFRVMHDELDALYSYPPERELHAALVNGLTRLAYGILTAFPDLIDLPAKLRAVPGAVQKYLVVLTRLAFSEGPLLESGITDETVEMANEMLEDAVNPQEAEALLEAFRSSKSDEREIP